MAKFVKGDIVVIPFPFSDLSGSKRRPAMVIADLPGSDIILCQITSRYKKDKYAVELSLTDFETGGLPVQSYIRISRIFTADKNIILRRTGTVRKLFINNILKKIRDLFASINS